MFLPSFIWLNLHCTIAVVEAGIGKVGVLLEGLVLRIEEEEDTEPGYDTVPDTEADTEELLL